MRDSVLSEARTGNYEVYIRGGSLERKSQTTIGSRVNARAGTWARLKFVSLFAVCVINQPVHRT